jgi:predicted transcriptional regulator
MGRQIAKIWRDPNGAHARLYHSILNCPAWIALSSTAIRLYIDMRLKLTSYNNGNVEAVYSELQHRGWRSKTTMHRALRELETLGFIERTRQGGIATMSKVCNLYRFTDLDSLDFEKQGVMGRKATHDYRRFTSIRQARAVVREAEARHRQFTVASQEKAKVRKEHLTSPVSVPTGVPH